MKLRYVLCLALCGCLPAREFLAAPMWPQGWRVSDGRTSGRTWPLFRFGFRDGVNDFALIGDLRGRTVDGSLRGGELLLSSCATEQLEFLSRLDLHERFSLTLPGQAPQWYQVVDHRIVVADNEDPGQPGDDTVTMRCLPVDAEQSDGERRYIVYARRLPQPLPAQPVADHPQLAVTS
jgi:hypothetical protein